MYYSSCRSVSQKSWMALIELQSRCLRACTPFWELLGRICFLVHLSRWQNFSSLLWEDQGPASLLGVSRGPFPTSLGSLQSLPSGTSLLLQSQPQRVESFSWFRSLLSLCPTSHLSDWLFCLPFPSLKVHVITFEPPRWSRIKFLFHVNRLLCSRN